MGYWEGRGEFYFIVKENYTTEKSLRILNFV